MILHNTDCSDDGFTNDVVTYEITPRPEAEAGTPTPERLWATDYGENWAYLCC